MSDPPKSAGLFSSLTLGRARPPKAAAPPSPEQPLAHPLLGAGASSSNLTPPSFSLSESHTGSGTDQAEAGPSLPRRLSWTKRGSYGELPNLPYKPRQRHATQASTSSIGSLTGSSTTGTTTAAVGGLGVDSPALAASVSSMTSPLTPTGAVTAAPTISTSVTGTFALPSSAMDAGDMSASVSTIGGSGSATSQLQRQSLKAAAQKIGLVNGTMGMAMLDAIFDKSQAGKGKGKDGAEWEEILNVLSSADPILLLPTTHASSLGITPQIVRDHLLFPGSPSGPGVLSRKSSDASGFSGIAARPATLIMSLSGLIGQISDSNVEFESSLPPDSIFLSSIKDNMKRREILASLRSTHPPLSRTSGIFPAYTLSSDSAALPFPAVTRTGLGISNDSPTKDKALATGRLGRINPFAGFFGTAPSGAEPSPSKQDSVAADNLTSSGPVDRAVSPTPIMLAGDQGDAASIRSTGSVPLQSNDGFSVTAYTVSKPIRFGEIQKSTSKALKALIRDDLSRMPDKVVDRIVKLVLSSLCPLSADVDATPRKGATDQDPSLQVDFSKPAQAGEKLQAIMEGVYDDLVLHFQADSSHLFSDPASISRKVSGSVPWPKREAEEETEVEKKARKERARREKDEYAEREATEGTERCEALVCRLLYNRLFSPLDSDDAKHDEALASRIAALNMLDLSLDHLGLITRPEDVPVNESEKTVFGLERIVHDVGLELQKLSTFDCLSPKAKADVLIAAHKLVVDGLSKLPPIKLRPEGEPYHPPAPSQRNNGASQIEVPTMPAPSVPFPPSEASSVHSRVSPSKAGARPPLSRNKSSASILSTSPAGPVPLTSPPSAVAALPGTQEDVQSRDQEPDLDGALGHPSADEDRPVPPPKETTTSAPTSGADLILPIIIYAVVKANPSQLASQLMYLRRYRSAICLTGEASYAIVNLTAVVEFLEHVDLAELGLGADEHKVMSVADLSPIGLDYIDETNEDTASIATASSRLRGRVSQVGELAGSAADSANKVITGVIDSSWSAVRGLITSNSPLGPASETVPIDPSGIARPTTRRQASTFSLANVTASVANIAAAAAATTVAARTRSRGNSRASAMQPVAEDVARWTGNQELKDVSNPASPGNQVSKPPSIREALGDRIESPPSGLDAQAARSRAKSDVRSIRSVTSMMQESKSEEGQNAASNGGGVNGVLGEEGKLSLGERLASLGLGRSNSHPGTTTGDGLDSPDSHATPVLGYTTSLSDHPSVEMSRHKPSSAFFTHDHHRRSSLSRQLDFEADTFSSRVPPAAVVLERIDPPLEKFMVCDLGDIRLSEVHELLRDYRRLGEAVQRINAQR